MATETMTRERPSRKAIPAKSWEAAEREFRDAGATMRTQPNDATVDRFCLARKQLLDTPAPNIAALNVKVQTLFELDDEGEYGHAWAADLLQQTRADCDRLLNAPPPMQTKTLDRIDTVTRYARCLIGAVDEALMEISLSLKEGSTGARTVADALDSTSMAVEYLSEIQRLVDVEWPQQGGQVAPAHPQPAPA